MKTFKRMAILIAGLMVLGACAPVTPSKKSSDGEAQNSAGVVNNHGTTLTILSLTIG